MFDTPHRHLRRSIQAFINGSPATLAQCKELGELLVDLHSQHAHQSLLRRSVQRELLDAFSETSEDASEVAEEAASIRALKHELETLRSSSNEIAERRDLLNYQIDELAALSFGDTELESLESDQKVLSNATWIMETVHSIAEQCASLSDQLRSSVSQLSDDRLGTKIDESRELVSSSQIQLEEAASELRRFLDGVELDPERLGEVESRLDTAYSLARKHRIRPEELAGHLETLSTELENLEHGSQRLDELEAEIETRHARWKRAPTHSPICVERVPADWQSEPWSYWHSLPWSAVRSTLASSILMPKSSTRAVWKK